MCCTSYTMKGIIRATNRNRKVGANKSTRLSARWELDILAQTMI
jgi:hypothetical protein